MNGRKAKLRRREHPKEIPELNMSWGPNRNQRRQINRVKDRSFTRPSGQQVQHIINDYHLQREPSHPPAISNHQRHLLRRHAR